MKRFIVIIMVAVAHMCTAIVLSADVKADIPSPDGKTVVSVIEREGQVYYQVEHDGKRFVHSSRLGLRTNAFDFSLREFVTSDFERIQGTYSMDRSKASEMSYDVTKAVLTFKNPKDKTIQIEFRVGNNDVAFRYFIPKEVPTTWDEIRYIAGFPGENVVVARRNGDKWYVAAVNAVEQPFEIKVKDILEKLGVEDAPVRLIDGGNEPVESAVKASRKVSVAKNDAAILVIG